MHTSILSLFLTEDVTYLGAATWYFGLKLLSSLKLIPLGYFIAATRKDSRMTIITDDWGFLCDKLDCVALGDVLGSNVKQFSTLC